MAPLLYTKFWSGNKLDRSTWSIKSIPGGSCRLKIMGPTDVSLERMRTISRGEGWGHCLYSAELARTTGRLNMATMSVAQSISSWPSIEKCRLVGLQSRLEVMVW